MIFTKESDTKMMKRTKKTDISGHQYVKTQMLCDNCLQYTDSCNKCGYVFACKCRHNCYEGDDD